MNLKKQYYNRILPVVGDVLTEKNIAFFDARLSCIAADAFARCGLKRLSIFDSSRVEENDQIALFFGKQRIVKLSSKAVEESIKAHNQFEKDWKIKTGESLTADSFQKIAKQLIKEKPDLIFGGGGLETCLLLNKLARETGIHAVIFFLLEKSLVNSGIVVVDKMLKNDFDLFIRQNKANISGNFPIQRRLDLLDCMDIAMNIARAVIFRGTAHEQVDLGKLIFEQKRNLMLRGAEEWPWLIQYVNMKKQAEWLRKIFSYRVERYYPQLDFLKNKSVMVIGCGTGSLFLGEAVNFFRKLLLIDCKKFSIFNPVRQLAGTRYIGRKKPYALQQILSRRVMNRKKIRETKIQRTFTDSVYQLSASELELKEYNPESVRKFKALLQWFKPDLVVVAMGRTQDDNFVATRILRKHEIKHIIPSAFPSVTHFKNIVVDGKNGPCYSCLQSRLPVDVGPGPTLTREQMEMFYGGTQPATVFETWPSVHALMRLSIETLLPDELRSRWFTETLKKERNCFVGANKAEKKARAWLYGVQYSGQVVCYGAEDIVGTEEVEVCECGRKNTTKYILR